MVDHYKPSQKQDDELKSIEFVIANWAFAADKLREQAKSAPSVMRSLDSSGASQRLAELGDKMAEESNALADTLIATIKELAKVAVQARKRQQN